MVGSALVSAVPEAGAADSLAGLDSGVDVVVAEGVSDAEVVAEVVSDAEVVAEVDSEADVVAEVVAASVVEPASAAGVGGSAPSRSCQM